MRLRQIARGRTVICILIAGLLCILHGCQGSASKRVSTGTFDQIQPGVTTAAWLRTTLGEPTTRQQYTEHLESWGWLYRTHKNSDGSWSVELYGSGAKAGDRLPPGDDRGQCYAEFKDGVLEHLTMTDPKANFGGEWASGVNTRTGNATRPAWMPGEGQNWDVR